MVVIISIIIFIVVIIVSLSHVAIIVVAIVAFITVVLSRQAWPNGTFLVDRNAVKVGLGRRTILKSFSVAPQIKLITVGLRDWGGDVWKLARWCEPKHFFIGIHSSKRGLHAGKNTRPRPPRHLSKGWPSECSQPLAPVERDLSLPDVIQTRNRNTWVMWLDANRALDELQMNWEELMAPRTESKDSDKFGVDAVADCRVQCHNTEGDHFGTNAEVMTNLLNERSWKQLEYILLRTVQQAMIYHRTCQWPKADRPNHTRNLRILLFCRSGKHRSVAAAEILMLIFGRIGVGGDVMHLASCTSTWTRGCGGCEQCTTPLEVHHDGLSKLIQEKVDLDNFARAVRLPF